MRVFPKETNKRVGRDGFLSLRFERVGERTVLTRSLFRNPLQVFHAMELDGGRCAYTPILNPSGGIIGGDRLKMDVFLTARSHALISTPSATRVYRSLGPPSVQTARIEIGPEAVLEWLPDTLIPYAGSRFEQKLDITIDPSSTMILWDAYSTGRVACGEQWKFDSLSNEIRINISSGGLVLERYHLEPGKWDPRSPGLGEDWDYFASFYVIGGEKIKSPDFLGPLDSILYRSKDRVMGGLSECSVPGLVIRLAARSAVDLHHVQTALWETIRTNLLGLPLPDLRKY